MQVITGGVSSRIPLPQALAEVGLVLMAPASSYEKSRVVARVLGESDFIQRVLGRPVERSELQDLQGRVRNWAHSAIVGRKGKRKGKKRI